MDLTTNNILGSDDSTNNDTFVPKPNEQQLGALRYMASLGLRPTAIASQLEVATDHLLSCCEHELKDAINDSRKDVVKTLYELAVFEKNPSAGVQWLKINAPDLLSAALKKEDSQKSTKKKPYVWDPNDPNDRVIFSVYNNDGEPNADY